MNRIIQLQKELSEIKKRRRRVRSEAAHSLATSINRKLRDYYSRGQAAFTHKGLDDGNIWLKVKIGEAVESLSRFTRVKDVSKRGGREYFTIIEGPHAGKKASVKAMPEGSRFKSVSYDDEGGVITYSIAEKEMTYGSNTSPIKTYMSNALPKGTYKLMLPDYPHAGGNGYTDLAPEATVWFRIVDPNDADGDRYLHVGKATAGCVTCGEATTAGGSDADRKRWSEVYNYLIRRRPDKSLKYVGELKVV